MKKMKIVTRDAGLIKNVAVRIIFFLTGAFVLCAFSIIQKLLLGSQALSLIFVARAYVVPVTYGGITGLIIGEWYLRIKKDAMLIQESEERLRTLINAIPDFVIFKNGEGRWLDINTASRKFFSFSNGDYYGKTDLDLAEQHDSMGNLLHWCHITDEETWESQELNHCSLETFPVQSQVKSFDVVKVPLYWPDGARKGLVTVGRDITAIKQSERKLAEAYDSTLAGWAKAMEFRDKHTEDHTNRVVEMTEKLARLMGIPDDDLVHVRRGAMLHDIGKISVPDSILRKPGPLNDKEWKIMRQHPRHAYQMLEHIDFLKKALDIPYCHHENWDGTGYPNGLRGEDIPLIARIFAIVDVWDALTSDRPYRKAWDDEKSIEYIREQSGKKFDPGIVELFFSVINSQRVPQK
jgi:PAS domain S-box-containing protein/putative nucleotidyltransferase with HDIG domain